MNMAGFSLPAYLCSCVRSADVDPAGFDWQRSVRVLIFWRVGAEMEALGVESFYAAEMWLAQPASIVSVKGAPDGLFRGKYRVLPGASTA